MSWAADRKTSRVEDMAYSLLGIFDINMPLLYGEGKKAFRRLQEHIIDTTEDYTIFTWEALNKSQYNSDSLSLLAEEPSTSRHCQLHHGNTMILAPYQCMVMRGRSRPYQVRRNRLV
jgi:hypothetical protein